MVSIDESRPAPSVAIEAGMAVIRLPLDQVHGLRVVLAGCPCRATKSHNTAEIRTRLDQALARLPLVRR